MQTLAAAGAEAGAAPDVVGVERALMQREHRNEGDIGEHDARHLDRARELLWLAHEPGRGEPHEQRHVEIDEAEQGDLRQDEKREHLAREAACLLGAVGLQHPGVGRQIGGVERPLAENLAELVGKLDRRDIGVVERPPAHERRERDVAQESGQPRGDRPAADQEDIAVHRVRFSRIRGAAAKDEMNFWRPSRRDRRGGKAGCLVETPHGSRPLRHAKRPLRSHPRRMIRIPRQGRRGMPQEGRQGLSRGKMRTRKWQDQSGNDR